MQGRTPGKEGGAEHACNRDNHSTAKNQRIRPGYRSSLYGQTFSFGIRQECHVSDNGRRYPIGGGRKSQYDRVSQEQQEVTGDRRGDSFAPLLYTRRKEVQEVQQLGVYETLLVDIIRNYVAAVAELAIIGDHQQVEMFMGVVDEALAVAKACDHSRAAAKLSA